MCLKTIIKKFYKIIILKMSSFSSRDQEIYVELGGCRVRDVEITGEISIEKVRIWPDRRNYVELGGCRVSERSS